MKIKRLVFFSLVFVLVLFACSRDEYFEVDLSKKSYELINQDFKPVKFPDLVNNKVTVLNFIFTNCPDICPLSTNNMRLVQEELAKEKITNVEFVSISFDPDFDKPSILKKFAEVRNLNLSNWSFLTGEKKDIDELTKDAEIFYVVSDSTVFKDGRKIFYYVHTDRIAIMNKDHKIVKHFIGSTADTKQIVQTVKSLL